MERMKETVSIDVGGCRFAMGPTDHERSTHEQSHFVSVQINTRFSGWMQGALPVDFLVAMADTIYRAYGRQPRDAEAQTVRVELVAAAPPAPVVQDEPQELDEVGQIRKRMLEGR